MKRWILTLVPLLVLGSLITWRVLEKRAGSGGQGQPRDPRRMPASVELATAEMRDIVNAYETTGTVESLFDVKISPKVSGRIETPPGRKDLVREGDRVQKDDVLFLIDSSDITAQVHQQEAALAQAKYRLAQAVQAQKPADAAVETQIRQQEAAVTSARADTEQVRANAISQVEAVKANIIDAEHKIAGATAAQENARAAIKSAQANLDNAKAKYERILGLYKQGFVAAQDVDDAKTTVSVQQSAVEAAQGQLKTATASYNSANAQKQAVEHQLNIVQTKGKADITAATAKLQQAEAALKAAKANEKETPAAYQESINALASGVDAARASLESVKARLADTTILSPISGIVTGRHLDPGGIASPSQPVLTIEAQHQVWVTISVPEDVCMRIHLNQTAVVRFDSLPGQTFTATIAQINPSADAQSRQFTVRAILTNEKSLFKSGMFARVAIETGRLTQATVVPQEAIKEDDDGTKYVMGIDAESKAKRCPVVTGPSDAKGTAIISGVKPGDKVVVMSSSALEDGKPIRLNDGKGGGEGRRGREPGGESGGGPGGRPGGAGERRQGGPGGRE